jgi:hypothetical protein
MANGRSVHESDGDVALEPQIAFAEDAGGQRPIGVTMPAPPEVRIKSDSRRDRGRNELGSARERSGRLD